MPFVSLCPFWAATSPGGERKGDQDPQGRHAEKQNNPRKEVPFRKGLITQIAQPNLESQDPEGGKYDDRKIS